MQCQTGSILYLAQLHLLHSYHLGLPCNVLSPDNGCVSANDGFAIVSLSKSYQTSPKKKLCLVPFVKLSQKSLPAFFSSRKFTTKFSIPQKSSGCNFQSPKGGFFPPVTIIPVADMGEGPRGKKTYPLPLSSRSVKPAIPKA